MSVAYEICILTSVLFLLAHGEAMHDFYSSACVLGNWLCHSRPSRCTRLASICMQYRNVSTRRMHFELIKRKDRGRRGVRGRKVTRQILSGKSLSSGHRPLRRYRAPGSSRLLLYPHLYHPKIWEREAGQSRHNFIHCPFSFSRLITITSFRYRIRTAWCLYGRPDAGGRPVGGAFDRSRR